MNGDTFLSSMLVFTYLLHYFLSCLEVGEFNRGIGEII